MRNAHRHGDLQERYFTEAILVVARPLLLQYVTLVNQFGCHGKLRAGENLFHVLRVIPALSYQLPQLHPGPKVLFYSSHS